MMVIVGAQSQLGKALINKLNSENFNYLVLVDTESIFEKELLENTKYWYLVLDESSVEWIEQNTEEIEFIVFCRPINNSAESIQFNLLWELGYQHQIPIIGIGTSEEEVKEVISTEQPPFFWTILLAENPQTKPEVNDVAQGMYYYIRNRQNSGIRTLGEVPTE